MDTTHDDADTPPGAIPPAGGRVGDAFQFLRDAVESGRLFDKDELPKLLEELGDDEKT